MAKFIHEGDQKKKYVKQMFNDISSTYDIINIISSFGIDRYWRYKLVNKIKMTSGQKLLDVAKKLGQMIERKLGINVIYTRENDIFIPLWKRTKIANQADGKLFISLHANSSAKNSHITGFETYLLNVFLTRLTSEISSIASTRRWMPPSRSVLGETDAFIFVSSDTVKNEIFSSVCISSFSSAF